jgi:CRP-like cAMP-binding protein
MSDRTSPENLLLRLAHFFDDLSEDDLKKIADLAMLEQWAAGKVLFREGLVSENLFLINQGTVALDMQIPQRGQVRILTIGPGEVLAWSALLSDQRMTAMATVLEEATLISIPGPKLKELCESDPGVGYAVMRRIAVTLAHRLLATRLQLLDLFRETQPT